MSKALNATCNHHGWLDKLAISMSMICAIHCLITPALIVLLPILSTTFWVHEDFHLWMIGLVIPTTTLAVFSGCRKHKDKIVIFSSSVALVILVSITLYESFFHSTLVIAEHSHCAHCTNREAGIFNKTTILNIFGGLLLAGAHVRNFILCRKSGCTH